MHSPTSPENIYYWEESSKLAARPFISPPASSWWGDGSCWYGNWLVNLSGCQCTNSHSNHRAASQHVACYFWWAEVWKVYYIWCVTILRVITQRVPAAAAELLQYDTERLHADCNPHVPYPPNQENHSHTCTVTFHKHIQRCSKTCHVIIFACKTIKFAATWEQMPSELLHVRTNCHVFRQDKTCSVCVYRRSIIYSLYSISVESCYHM